jgi:hypothetical protein
MEEDKEEMTPVLIVEESFPEHDLQKKKNDHSPGSNKKLIRRIIGIVMFALLIYGSYRFFFFYITPNRTIQQTYLIPKDAVFIIQTDNPVTEWKQFSKGKPKGVRIYYSKEGKPERKVKM